jgi:biopolymer transport protein ExbD
MPIVVPGKRPAKRFQKSKVLGGKIVKGRKATNADLNVVPMVDMMTMLVIFLLQQFSSTGEVLYMQKDIKLPTAQHGQMIEIAPVVAVSGQQVVVTGVKVADIAELDSDSGYLNIPALEERLGTRRSAGTSSTRPTRTRSGTASSTSRPTRTSRSAS